MFIISLFYIVLTVTMAVSAISAFVQWRNGERLHSLLFLAAVLLVLYIEGDAAFSGLWITAFPVLWVMRVIYLVGCVYYLWENGTMGKLRLFFRSRLFSKKSAGQT